MKAMKTEYELYDMTPSEAISYAVERVASEFGICKKDAKKLVLNTLIYNCVIEEIVGQAEFLIGEEK